jgi:hypothetical protein
MQVFTYINQNDAEYLQNIAPKGKQLGAMMSHAIREWIVEHKKNPVEVTV